MKYEMYEALQVQRFNEYQALIEALLLDIEAELTLLVERLDD